MFDSQHVHLQKMLLQQVQGSPEYTLNLWIVPNHRAFSSVLYSRRCIKANVLVQFVKGLFRAYYIRLAADYNIAIAHGEFKYADIITAFVLICTLFSVTKPHQNYFPIGHHILFPNMCLIPMLLIIFMCSA